MSDDTQNPSGPHDRGTLEDFLQLPPEEQRRRILIQPFYPDVKNEIVQPDRVTVQSRYFWERWARILGPLDTVLFLRLRQYCYWNRDTGEKRDWCFPSQSTLAEEVGIDNPKTVALALARLELHGLLRREPQYRYDPVLRKKLRTTDKYHVLMEDPLTPDDVPQAFVKAAERMLRPDGGNLFDKPPSPKSEKRIQVDFSVDNRAPKSEKRSYEAIRKTERKKFSEESLKRSNVGKAPLGQDPRKANLALELVEELEDEHSARFYRLVVERMPENIVRMVLSETKGAYREGRIQTRPGAYFTGAIKAQAQELGIELGVGE